MKTFIVFLTGLTIAGCGGGNGAPRAESVVVDSPRTIVDSIFPVEEEIRRFKTARNNVGARALTDGATSRDELVRKFIAALEQHDTATLRALVLSDGEFIDLYYPASIYSRPPYKQSPELRWFLMQENSRKGFHRLMQRYGGFAIDYHGHECAPEQLEGPSRIWDRCRVSWSVHATPIRLFSTVIERDGNFKFLSYANDL